MNPKYAQAWKYIGHIFYETNNSENAVKYYTRALNIEPNDIESKIGKANCHYLLEHFDDAITAYEEICEVD